MTYNAIPNVISQMISSNYIKYNAIPNQLNTKLIIKTRNLKSPKSN